MCGYRGLSFEVLQFWMYQVINLLSNENLCLTSKNISVWDIGCVASISSVKSDGSKIYRGTF